MEKGILVAVIIILVVGAVLFVPISPTLTVTFSITPSSAQVYVNNQYVTNVSLSVVTAAYSRQTLIRSLAGPAGITLPIMPLSTGPYILAVSVFYANPSQAILPSPIAQESFNNVGGGTYGIQATFLVPHETQGLSYIVTFQLTGTGIVSNPVSIVISPS